MSCSLPSRCAKSHCFSHVRAGEILAPLLVLSLSTLTFASPEDLEHAVLANGNHIPLVGLGVGNLQHELIEGAIEEAVVGQGLRLIDTAAKAGNEQIISEALSKSHVGSEVLVLTKVWYTHLGFERTLLSARESLSKLRRKQIDILLLHWPRCRADIPWMHCAEEEEALEAEVKAAGPSPGPDAWKNSWRALEQLYRDGQVRNIGVSNFDTSELRELVAMAKVKPQLIQENVWKVSADPDLMRLVKDEEIHFQAYNVMGLLSEVRQRRPDSYQVLERLAQEISGSAPQVLQRWLLQQGISVIPRSSQSSHLRENAQVVSSTMSLSDVQMGQVRRALEEFIRGDQRPDPKEFKPDVVRASFVNSGGTSLHVFWLQPETGEEIPATAEIQPGNSHGVQTFPGHRFVARDAVGREEQFLVTAALGESQLFTFAHSEL